MNLFEMEKNPIEEEPFGNGTLADLLFVASG